MFPGPDGLAITVEKQFPNTPFADTQFVFLAYKQVFGHSPVVAEVADHFNAQLAYLKGIYVASVRTATQPMPT